MPTLLQINVNANWGSTGRISESIGLSAMNRGWNSYIAYGRNYNKSQSKIIKIGNKIDTYIHYAIDKLCDKEGRGSINSTNKFIKQILEIKPDIIHLHNIHDHYLNYPILFDFFNNYSANIVWTFHDCWAFTGHCYHFVEVNCNKWKVECEKCPLKNNIYDRSNENYLLKKQYFTKNNIKIITVSNWLKKLVEQSFFKNNDIITIHNGIDLNVFKPTQSIKKNNSICQIIAVSNIWPPYKGLKDIIKIRDLLPENFKITVVGLSNQQIKKLPKGIKGISRTQNIQELVKLYNESDMLINPTYADSFPTVNLEALACGIPVITYNTCGSPEAIDEKTGFVIQQGNIVEMAEAIKNVAHNSINPNDCRKRSEQYFDKNKCFDSYIKLYESMLK